MASAAARTGVTEFSIASDTQLRFVRVVNAPRRLVFEAYTMPEHLKRWLGFADWSMPICEMEPRAGGKWRYGWRSPDGTEMSMGGIVKEFVPPERISTTEQWGPEWPETLNTVTFTEANGTTTITTTVTYPSKDARDAALESGMRDGLDVSYARFDKLLESLQ
ncbi:MAG TPA: SRPBCC family protein [Gemmatimonadales bacterium]|nr:SRPBCC family protein [Gemmatimonadales bacterium]